MGRGSDKRRVKGKDKIRDERALEKVQRGAGASTCSGSKKGKKPREGGGDAEGQEKEWWSSSGDCNGVGGREIWANAEGRLWRQGQSGRK